MPAQEPVASSISRSKLRALLEPLRLEQLALGDELVEALARSSARMSLIACCSVGRGVT